MVITFKGKLKVLGYIT